MTTADIISLIVLIVALNALITGVFLSLIDRNRKRLKQNVKLLEAHTKYADSLVSSNIAYAVKTETRVKLLESLIVRLISESASYDASFKKRVSEELSKLSREIKKANYELMAHSNDRTTKLSAYRKLSQSFGGIASLELMSDLLEHEEQDDGVLRSCVNDLRKRLED